MDLYCFDGKGFLGPSGLKLRFASARAVCLRLLLLLLLLLAAIAAAAAIEKSAIEKLVPHVAVAGGVAGAWPVMAHGHVAEPVARMWEAL